MAVMRRARNNQARAARSSISAATPLHSKLKKFELATPADEKRRFNPAGEVFSQ
jgi:hypothetical protein